MAANNRASLELSAQGQRVIAKMVTADAMPILRRKLREATDPLQPAIRSAAKALPSSSKLTTEKGGSLRAAVAATVKRTIRLSSRTMLIAITNQPHGGKSNLARALDGDIPWVHPTFGHAPTITQAAHPFFWDTLARYAPAVEIKVSEVLTEFEREL